MIFILFLSFLPFLFFCLFWGLSWGGRLISIQFILSYCQTVSGSKIWPCSWKWKYIPLNDFTFPEIQSHRFSSIPPNMVPLLNNCVLKLFSPGAPCSKVFLQTWVHICVVLRMMPIEIFSIHLPHILCGLSPLLGEDMANFSNINRP